MEHEHEKGAQPASTKTTSSSSSTTSSRLPGVGAVQGYSAQQLMLKPSAQPGYMDQLQSLRPELRDELLNLDEAELKDPEVAGEIEARAEDEVETPAPEPLEQVQLRTDSASGSSSTARPAQSKLASRERTVKAGTVRTPTVSYKASDYKGNDTVNTAVGCFHTEVRGGRQGAAFTILKDNPLAVTGLAWRGLTSAERMTHLNALTRDADVMSDKGDQILKTMAFTVSELDVVTKAFELRFNLSVGQTLSTDKTGKDWDVAGLRRCWAILELLPAEHVENSPDLDHWTRFVGGYGWYNSGRDEASFGYDGLDSTTRGSPEGNHMDGVNWFNETVRHEVGHAVDNQLGSTTDAIVINAGPKWQTHGAQAALTAMLAAGGTIATWADAGQKREIEAVLLDCMQNNTPDDLYTNLAAMSCWGDLSSSEQDSIKYDRVALTVKDCGSEDKAPWNNLSSMGWNVGGRHYQVHYDARGWTSYDPAALGVKVSRYQFRAQGEWFAEAYACYYHPDTSGNTGTMLAEADSGTKRWFDANVATMGSGSSTTQSGSP